MEGDEASSNIARKNDAKFLCTPIGSLKKSFVKQKSSLSRKQAALAGNTSVVFKQSLTSNNRQLARTLEKTKQELADALNTNLSLAHENSVLASKVLAFRRLAELKNDEVEHELQSRMQQRLHCISDMLNDIIRSRSATTDLLAAAADACRGFTAKTVENLFEESIQYCSKLPSRVPVGAQRWHPFMSTCREQLDSTRDELGADDVAESNEPRAQAHKEICTPDNPLSATVLLDTSASSSMNETVVATSADQSLVHSADVHTGAAELRPQKPLLIHDDIPVGPRLSGSFCRPEQVPKSDTAKPDVPVPSSGLYEVVLSPPKIFKKYIDGGAPTASSSAASGVRKNQPGSRRVGNIAPASKNASQVTLPTATAADSRSRRRSTFSLGRSQEANIDILADTGTSIADESDSILATTPDLDITVQGGRLSLDKATECKTSDLASAHVVDYKAASNADLPCSDDSTALATQHGISKTADTESHQAAAQPIKAPMQSALPSRQMDIVMSKPGELHFVVGSRDGTRHPNLSEVRQAGSSRSKKRQTFVASSVKPSVESNHVSGAAGKVQSASVFDFKDTSVVVISKDAVDAYELSLSESLVSELPRPQYRSEAAAAAAATAAAVAVAPLVVNDQSTLKGFKQSHTKEKDMPVPNSTSAELRTHVGSLPSAKSSSVLPTAKSKQSKKSQGRSRQQQPAKENEDGRRNSTSPTKFLKTEQKAPLSPLLSAQIKKTALAVTVESRSTVCIVDCALATADSRPAKTPSWRGQEDSFDVFSDSMIEQYRQANGDSIVIPSKFKEPTVVISCATTAQSSDPASPHHDEPDLPSHMSEDHEVPKRRRCTSTVSYAEPPLGKKLRRGDPGTSTIYGADVAATLDHPKRSSTKHAKGSKL